MARRSILLSVAFAIAALGTAMIILYVQGIDARAAEGQQRVSVLTATDVISAGESVSDAQAAGKLEKTEIVRDDMVEGALSSTSSISDKVALGTIYPGQQIMGQQFGAPGSEQSLTIPDDKLAVSVELTDPERVAGFVNPGSWVAIFFSADPEIYKPDGTTQKLPQYTRILLPKVQVIGVGDTTVSSRTTTEDGKQTTEQIPRTILTLAVNQEEAERVIYAARNGDVSFALRTDKSQASSGPGVRAFDLMPEAFRGAR
jgi:pilus assembly protein CpaB